MMLRHEELAFAALIRACTKKKDVYTGAKLHADVQRTGWLLKSSYLGNTLISMYTKCGLLAQAEQVHEDLGLRNVITWNALIAGYAQQGRSSKAFNCLEQMQREGVPPNAVTFASILKACSKTGDITSGEEIHERIMSRGLLGKDVVLDNALVNMYAKCGEFEKAREVLEGIPVRNVVTWASLIAGYVQHGQCHEAMACFHQMKGEGISPDAIILACILKACGKSSDIDQGKRIHADILIQGLLENDVVLGNALVDMYALSNMLDEAQEVLDKLPIRNVSSWNALIAGYAQVQGRAHEALYCFEQMQHEGLPPDLVTFVCILKACGMLGDRCKGKLIHEMIMSTGSLKKDAVLGNALVEMYAKCGMLVKAHKVLEELCVRDVVSWSALIVGYIQQGQCHEALNCFEWMQNEGLSPDTITFTWILKACGRIGRLDKGKQIHHEIVQRGLLRKDAAVGNALVDMYTKCGMLMKAQEILQELPTRSAISWSVLIAGYTEQGKCHEALKCFNQMQRDGLSPDAVTFICVLKACGSIGALDKGEKIHGEIVKANLLDKDATLASALVDMYAKCGMFSKALELTTQNAASCSAILSGYVQQGQGYEALAFLQQMKTEGVFPDVITYICILKACSKIGAVESGQQIHEEIISRSLLGKGPVLGNSLLDMYIKCGMLEKAQVLLEKLPIRDEISWSSLIWGYAEQEQGHEALNCFHQMRGEGLFPNVVTYISLLKACAITGCIAKGKQIHEEISSKGLLVKDIILGTALVDMYAKCGMLINANQVLEELPDRNLVSWNALIAGYAQDRQCHEALRCFEQMKKEGLSPDGVTFVSVLTACSHSGLLDDGQMLFADMTKIYCIVPNLEHYTCMVSLYGCAGYFNKVMSMIEAMPSLENPAIWLTLLSVCGKWGNLKLGKLAFDQVIQLDNSCSAAYILMADIFLDAGMQDDAGIIDAMRLKYAVMEDQRSGCK